MATYVGSLRACRRFGKSCWMVASSIGELQEMAMRLGLQLRWMKQGPARFVLTESQRQAAVWAGAIPCSHADVVRFAESGVQPGTMGWWPGDADEERPTSRQSVEMVELWVRSLHVQASA